MRQRYARGFGLVEAVIVLAAAGLLVAGTTTVYRLVSANLQAHKTATQALKLTEAVNRAWASAPSFVGISNSRVVAENLLPPGFEISGPAIEPVISTAFGGRLLVDPSTIEGQEGRGLLLTLTDVPRRVCGSFVSRTSEHGYRSVRINSNDVLDSSGRLQEQLVASQCAQPRSTVSFLVDRNFTGSGTAAYTPPVGTPGAPCQLPDPAFQTQTDSCPGGQVGSITRTRTATCPPGASTPQWGPWSVSGSCASACKPEPHSPQRRTSTPCPADQIGAITEVRVSQCPSAVGSPVWSPWTVVSNTCAPLCMAPADELDVSTPCPAGQSGSIVRRRSATCESANGPWQWQPWEVISNTCQ
ncbi:type 4 pilus major pilin [Luteimonas sp. SDU101]|uniref:type 4 pilus major pilin n=1 Tax=Luteimonas sp. SDU101 TaxID=3422593 RepID=UPI003EBC162C